MFDNDRLFIRRLKTAITVYNGVNDMRDREAE